MPTEPAAVGHIIKNDRQSYSIHIELLRLRTMYIHIVIVVLQRKLIIIATYIHVLGLCWTLYTYDSMYAFCTYLHYIHTYTYDALVHRIFLLF